MKISRKDAKTLSSDILQKPFFLASWRPRARLLFFVSFVSFVVNLFFSPTHSPGAEKTLRFVTWKPEVPRVWDDAIAEFERSNPGVRVVREIGPQSSTQLHDLISQKLKNRDTGVDVFVMDVIWPAEFASAGWVLPLDSFFTANEQQQFLRAPITANRYSGRIFGVPLFIDAGVLYYRRDLLEKNSFAAPRFWPELVQQAKAILRSERDPQLAGFSAQFKQYEGLVCNMMEFIVSNGGALWDETRMKGAIDEKPALDAIRFVRDEIVGQISSRGLLAYEEPESLALFTEGRAIFHRNWPYAGVIANDSRQSKVAGRVGMAPLPSFPGHPGASALGGWQLAISRFSRQPELAWRFVSFISGEAMQKRIAVEIGKAPTRVSLYKDRDVLAAVPHLKTLQQIFEQAVPRPVTPVYTPLSNILQRYFSSVLTLPDADLLRRSGAAARDMNRVLDLLGARN